jgi:hypothetical protein
VDAVNEGHIDFAFDIYNKYDADDISIEAVLKLLPHTKDSSSFLDMCSTYFLALSKDKSFCIRMDDRIKDMKE